MAHDFEYIRKSYGLNLGRGMRVTALGKPGIVTGTESAHVMVKLDDMKFSRPYHPSDVVPTPAKA